VFCFFFSSRRRHTRSKRDWSSDVCSSDLLTHFYLSLATGGALGGILVGLVAPQVFDGYWEMPLAVLCLSGLGLWCCSEELGRGRSEERRVGKECGCRGGPVLEYRRSLMCS